MTTRKPISPYSPQRTDPRVRELIFVGRHRLAAVALDRLKASMLTGDKHHLLFVGPRGSGKSHLLYLLVDRLKADPDVRARARIAELSEDKSSPTFSKFLIQIIEALRRDYPGEFREPPRTRLKARTEAEQCRLLSDQLLGDLAGHVLLVTVENLDQTLFHLGVEGQNRWRAFLTEHPVTATLATAQQLSHYLADRDHLFFGFFEIDRLAPLRTEEAVDLLRKIADLQEDHQLAAYVQSLGGRGRVRVLMHLSGGNHRVFIFLSEFVTWPDLEDLVAAFERLVEELTPYYQERLRWLDKAPVEREVVEYLCQHRRPASVQEVAHELVISDSEARDALAALVDKGYLNKLGSGRQARFELAEPLMRICIEVKDPRAAPIRLIIEFLRLWFDQEMCEALLEKLPAEATRERRYVEAAIREHQSDVEHPLVAELRLESRQALSRGDLDKRTEHLAALAEIGGSASDWAEYCVVLAEQGQIDLAAAAANRALAKEPDLALARHCLGVCLGKLGRLEEALPHLERTVELTPRDKLAWLNKSIILGNLLRYEEALAAVARAVALAPADAKAWRNKGVLQERLGRYEEALADYEHALAIDVRYALAWHSKSVALERLGRDADSLAACERALAIDAGYAPAWRSKGIALEKLGRYAEALADYEQALAIDAGYAPAWRSKGVALEKLGRYAEALAACDRALALDATYSAAWNSKGVALERLSRYEEALAAFGRAVALAPADAEARRNNGVALERLGRDEEALADYEHALALDATYALAWHSKGVAQERLGRYAEALESHDRALALEPHYKAAWHSKAIVLENLGQYAAAHAAWERVLALDEGDAFAWMRKGVALGNLARPEEAVAALDRALALDDTSPKAWHNRSVVLESLGRYAEALAACDRALALDAGYALAWNSKGHIYNILGRFPEALAACDQAAELDPGLAVTLETRAEVHTARGDWAAAIRYLSERLTRFPPQATGGRWVASERDLINATLRNPAGDPGWAARVADLVGVGKATASLPYLGVGLVGSLRFVPADLLGTPSLAAWLTTWQAACQGVAEMDLPLRLFETGLRYLATPDEGVFHTLPVEERAVLRDVFRLPAEV